VARPGGGAAGVNWRVGGDVDRMAGARLGRTPGRVDLLRLGWLAELTVRAVWSGLARDAVALVEAVGGAGRGRRLLVLSFGGWRADVDGRVRGDRDQAA